MDNRETKLLKIYTTHKSSVKTGWNRHCAHRVKDKGKSVPLSGVNSKKPKKCGNWLFYF